MGFPLFDLVDELSQVIENWRESALEPSSATTGERALLSVLLGLGPSSVPQIARLRGVSRQHIQQQVNALAQRGWLASAPNPAHKRSPLFLLTDRGRAILETLQSEERNAVDRLRAGTSDEAVDDAIQVLSAWKEALLTDIHARDAAMRSS